MEHGVGAIHRTRAGNRFVLPATQQRERRLGLHGVFRTSSGPAPAPIATAARQPLQAIRSASRSAHGTAQAHRGADATMLRGIAGPRWSPARPLLRDSRIAGPSPWRE